MRLGWFPRDQKFYDMFEEVVGLIAQAAQVFVELVEHFDQRERRVGELRELEHNCDGAVARILEALGQAFVTPLDREDIHALATSLDEVLDNMEEAAHRLNAFQIDRPTPEALKMALLIHQAVGYLQRAVQLCRGQLSSAEMAQALREITRLENEADAVSAVRWGLTFQILLSWVVTVPVAVVLGAIYMRLIKAGLDLLGE